MLRPGIVRNRCRLSIRQLANGRSVRVTVEFYNFRWRTSRTVTSMFPTLSRISAIRCLPVEAIFSSSPRNAMPDGPTGAMMTNPY